MKYQINTTNYHTFEIFQVNKLRPRSYFIPYPTREQADAVESRRKRYASPKVLCLNGEWDFKFYPDPKELPGELDTDNIDFAILDVPSCWQFRGYDRPFYVNTRYQFPYHPPVIPTTQKAGRTFCWLGSDQKIGPRFQTPEEEYNFVGVYRRFFEITDQTKRYVLSFLGAASCLDVYVNGKFVGYSEGSHNTAEFEITSYLKQGKNELVAVVHRWCNGTYLEAQDMFRNNGIFRDVLLFAHEPWDIFDIDLKTRKEGSRYVAQASASLYGDGKVTFKLQGHGIHRTVTVDSKDRTAEAVFDDLEVQEWNAQDPVLYDLYYETAGTCIKQRIGFREVRIEKDVFLFNGKKIKLHGVNHHDTSCTNGYTMTPEELERDVALCKEYNIDTMRMSHYPPDPYLLELCDEKGIYVVDETDLETHGAFSQTLPPSYNRISHDPKWESHYIDRVSRMYERDKMHTSVILWSLGNEAGGYHNTDKEYAYLKARTDLPVHYEGVIHSKRKAYDVGSQMYPPLKRVQEVGRKTCSVKQLLDRPYFLCEYAHAMGVGPGNAEAYWKEIYAYDNLMGGCVWEMVDHAVLHPDGSYTYGGDHGEWEHDGNFCVDGIFYPDRTPSTGAQIIKYVYRPLRITHIGGDVFEIFNTTGFSHKGRYRLDCSWSDGSTLTFVPETASLTRERVTLVPQNKGTIQSDGRMLTISIVDTKTEQITAVEQFILEKAAVKAENSLQKTALPKSLQLNNGQLLIEQQGIRICSGKPYTILFRAATDNDTDLLMRNIMEPYYKMQEEVVSVVRTEEKMVVKIRIRIGRKRFLCTDTYEQCREGLLVTSHLHCERGGGWLPRFGKTYVLDPAFAQVEYFGRIGESYADMKEQWHIDQVKCKVTDMTEPNIRPQESGNRCDCTYACLDNGKQRVIFEAVQESFELSVKPYSDMELTKMKHREDEIITGTYVTINAFQMGIGTGSCGPVTAKSYRYPAKQEYELRFLIRIEEIS